MNQLDDRTFVTRLDPKGMFALTEGFADQCERALALSKIALEKVRRFDPDLIVLTGMGGSAAGGDLARMLFEEAGNVPFLVNRDYALPHFVGPGTCVFAVSYSGNTEETLSAYADARRRGARVVAISSGGELAKLAEADSQVLIRIPSGQPPRTALGFLFVPVVAACEALGWLPSQPHAAAWQHLRACAREWGVEAPAEVNRAKQLAARMHGALPILYGLGAWQAAVAGRWKSQINENAKCLAYANGFPELNHNEILGWERASGQGVARYMVVSLEDDGASAKMRTRLDVTERLIGNLAECWRISAHGNSLYERMLSLTYMGDFVSLYLAALVGVDPEDIASINHLKQELAKVQ